MAEPYVGEIREFSFGWAPAGWAACDGQPLSIGQFPILFHYIGTAFGGDGVKNFNLPNLTGRVPVGQGAVHVRGESGGEPTHELLETEMPVHLHFVMGASVAGDAPTPGGHVLAQNANLLYQPPGEETPLGPNTIGNVGHGVPHQNMAPFLSINFCIALKGVIPTRPLAGAER
jgi:microcystin-dependent protein